MLLHGVRACAVKHSGSFVEEMFELRQPYRLLLVRNALLFQVFDLSLSLDKHSMQISHRELQGCDGGVRLARAEDVRLLQRFEHFLDVHSILVVLGTRTRYRILYLRTT